jgi:perosamine synthetase
MKIGHGMQVKLADAIEEVLPKHRPIGHHDAAINGKEWVAVSDCLNDLTSDKYVTLLEDKISHYCDVSSVIATSSGTAALHLALLAVGVKPGEEVLVPASTFAGTAFAVSYCGAIPNFIDGTVRINAYKLRRYLERTTVKNWNRRGRLNSKTGRVISAIIAVDLLGFPNDMEKLAAVADEFGLTLIEDAAQALGASLGNRRCGSFGKAAILSFNNNKIVTGNGGGAVLTNDEWIAAKVWQLATTGRIKHPWKIEHDAIGFNYRMKNINAAIACAQFDQLDFFLQKKRELRDRYKRAISEIKEVGLLLTGEDWQGKPNYWLNAMLVPNKDREAVLDELNKRGIGARSLYTPLHKLSMYEDNPRDDLRSAEILASMVVCLPSGIGCA